MLSKTKFPIRGILGRPNRSYFTSRSFPITMAMGQSFFMSRCKVVLVKDRYFFNPGCLPSPGPSECKYRWKNFIKINVVKINCNFEEINNNKLAKNSSNLKLIYNILFYYFHYGSFMYFNWNYLLQWIHYSFY